MWRQWLRNAVYLYCQTLLAGFAVILWRGRAWGANRIPRHGGLIIASNHQSYLDPPLLGCFVPRILHFLARDTLFRNPVGGAIIRYVNAVPISRGSADLAAFRASLRVLQSGAGLMLFPEATRTADGRVHPIHAGVIALARKARVPIVPAAIEGLFDVWPRQARIPRGGRYAVEFGEPIMPSRIEAMSQEDGARYLTSVLRDLHNGLRSRAGRPPFDYAERQIPEQALRAECNNTEGTLVATAST